MHLEMDDSFYFTSMMYIRFELGFVSYRSSIR
jgi:hypothetical protein